MNRREVLDNGRLRAEVLPDLGGTIDTLHHVATGASVLGQVPWTPQGGPDPSGGAEDEAAWLARFGGGWPVMFPNAGDACELDGVRHGFHGEASVSPWSCARQGDALILTRRFRTVPALMTRRIRLSGDSLIVEEQVTAGAACEVMWGQHVTLGSDLLSGPVHVTTSARRAIACAVYDPPANPLLPAGTGDWPLLPGKSGPFDLSRPVSPCAALACLVDLGPAPWVQLRRLDGALSVRLDWTADPWPLAWFWIEAGGTPDAPWHSRGQVIGVEPCTTWPATGLAHARAAGGALLRLDPGVTRTGRTTLHIHTT